MKFLINKIKTEEKKKNNDKIKQLEDELSKIEYSDNLDKLQNALKEKNELEIRVINKNLHEIKNEILPDYTGEFEMVGELSIDDHIRPTHIRFRNINDYESYINAIDPYYESEDATFNDYIQKINTPQCNLVNRSQYGNGGDFKHEITEYRGNICFIQTKGYCFTKCVNFLTGEDYKQQYLHFIRNEKRRSNIMTKAKIQSFCRANNIILGYFDGVRVFPRRVTERNKALYLYNKHFF